MVTVDVDTTLSKDKLIDNLISKLESQHNLLKKTEKLAPAVILSEDEEYIEEEELLDEDDDGRSDAIQTESISSSFLACELPPPTIAFQNMSAILMASPGKDVVGGKHEEVKRDRQ